MAKILKFKQPKNKKKQEFYAKIILASFFILSLTMFILTFTI